MSFRKSVAVMFLIAQMTAMKRSFVTDWRNTGQLQAIAVLVFQFFTYSLALSIKLGELQCVILGFRLCC